MKGLEFEVVDAFTLEVVAGLPPKFGGAYGELGAGEMDTRWALDAWW
jgi:hypothetical protein